MNVERFKPKRGPLRRSQKFEVIVRIRVGESQTVDNRSATVTTDRLTTTAELLEAALQGLGIRK